MPIRSPRALLALSLLSLVVAAGCAQGPRVSEAPGASAAFVGSGPVETFIFTDIPQPVARGMGVTSLELNRALRGQLAAGGVPVGGAENTPSHVELHLSSLEVAPGQRAVWVWLHMHRMMRFPGRELPLAATVWERSGKVLVRDGDAAVLKREVERLAAEFVRLYRAAAPEVTATQP